MATILTSDETAQGDTISDAQIDGLVSRIMRSGHHLTPRSLQRIHEIITDCIPDDRLERGSMKDQAKALTERMERDNEPTG